MSISVHIYTRAAPPRHVVTHVLEYCTCLVSQPGDSGRQESDQFPSTYLHIGRVTPVSRKCAEKSFSIARFIYSPLCMRKHYLPTVIAYYCMWGN